MDNKHVELGIAGVGVILIIVGIATPAHISLTVAGLFVAAVGGTLFALEDQLAKPTNKSTTSTEQNRSDTESTSTSRTTNQSTSSSNFNANYGLVAFIGVLILAGGLMMPATETVTSESCTEGVWWGDSRVGGGCVEAETEVPNSDRGFVMVAGMVVTLVGGIGAIAADSSDSESNSTTQQTVNQTETTKNELGNQETQIRISAETKQSDSSETARSELTIETTDINEAKNEFLQHCNEQGLEVVSELRTEVIE